MTRKRLCALIALLSLALGPSVALAHEERNVGPISVTVGWAEEPAIAGLMNAVQVRLQRGDTPVTDDVDITAEVRFGSEMLGPLELSPYRPAPGEFRAPVIPTTPGAYIFKITGDAAGTKIDQEFKPGPDTFAEVEGPSALQFPQKAPTSVEVGRAISRLQDQAAAAEQRASTARTLAIAAVSVGILGLLIGLFGLISARRGRT